MENKKPKYNSLSEWRIAENNAYNAAWSQSPLDKICEVFGWKKNMSHGHWTLETCKKDAINYKTKGDWKKKSPRAYDYAKKKKWINECCNHMIHSPWEGRKPRGYWTLEKCKEDALKHKARGEWKNSKGSCFYTARDKNWIDECTKHMKKRGDK
jgi:hypothetical protein